MSCAFDEGKKTCPKDKRMETNPCGDGWTLSSTACSDLWMALTRKRHNLWEILRQRCAPTWEAGSKPFKLPCFSLSRIRVEKASNMKHSNCRSFKECIPFKLLCLHLSHTGTWNSMSIGEGIIHYHTKSLKHWCGMQPSFMSHRPGGSEQIIHFGKSRRGGQGMSMARLGVKHPKKMPSKLALEGDMPNSCNFKVTIARWVRPSYATPMRGTFPKVWTSTVHWGDLKWDSPS